MNLSPSHSRRALAGASSRTAGFTLIELMISVTIGLGILAGLVGVLSSNSANSRSNDKTSELLTNGRYGLNSIKAELREAGFRGYTWADPDVIAPATLATPGNECLQAGATAGAFVANIRQGVWGVDNAAATPNPFAANCIPAERFAAGSDILVMRRVAPFPATALVANRVYFQSAYERGQVFRGAVAPNFAGVPLASFELQEFVYYVSPVTNVAAPENPAVPSLRRVTLNAAGNMVDELVVSGIEHLQVQYGYLATNGTVRYLNAGTADPVFDLSADSFNAAASGWDNVNAVRIWLLARNTLAEPGYLNNNRYTMAGQDFDKNDSFRRQMFSTVVQLRN